MPCLVHYMPDQLTKKIQSDNSWLIDNVAKKIFDSLNWMDNWKNVLQDDENDVKVGYFCSLLYQLLSEKFRNTNCWEENPCVIFVLTKQYRYQNANSVCNLCNYRKNITNIKIQNSYLAQQLVSIVLPCFIQLTFDQFSHNPCNRSIIVQDLPLATITQCPVEQPSLSIIVRSWPLNLHWSWMAQACTPGQKNSYY